MCFCLAGYEMGCVSEARYQKASQMATDLTDNLAILKSIQLSVTKWQQLTNEKPVKPVEKIRR